MRWVFSGGATKGNVYPVLYYTLHSIFADAGILVSVTPMGGIVSQQLTSPESSSFFLPDLPHLFAAPRWSDGDQPIGEA